LAGVLTDAVLRPHLPALRAAARRASRVPHEADDLLQDALLEAVRAGRGDLSQADHRRWLFGTLAKLGAMLARTAQRRHVREAAWAADGAGARPAPPDPLGWWGNDADVRAWLDALPPSLLAVAQLALSGHERREIAWLLGIGDVALRQRIAALRRRLPDQASAALAAGSASPAALALPLGLIRRALLPVVVARQAAGAHDPDGHLLVLSGRGGTPLR
jgi:RNA polymerase sigma-70 factor (ECF subfamily)